MLLDQENCEYVETVLRAVARRKSLTCNGLGQAAGPIFRKSFDTMHLRQLLLPRTLTFAATLLLCGMSYPM